MAHALGKEIRELKDCGNYDLKNYTEDQAKELVQEAFAEPLELEQMIRFTFSVGAGKLDRARYHDDLPKWFCNALKDVGFEDDRGASLSFECAGTFKFQHDTGKNMKYVHVFPKVKVTENQDQGEDANKSDGDSMLPVDAEWLCVASEMDTFKQMVQVKMPAWIERRRCAQMLADQEKTLEDLVVKLAKLEALTPTEQRLFDSVEPDLLREKVAYLNDAMKELFDAAKLTRPEQKILLSQIDQKIETVEAELAQNPSDAKKKSLNNALTQAEARKKKIQEMTPYQHELLNASELKTVWKRLRPLQSLAEKAGHKGLWSGKLTPAEVAKLGEKEDLDETEATLLAAARHWFEDIEEFQARVDLIKKPLMAEKSKPQASQSKPAESDGWNTVGGGAKKKSGSGAKGGASKGKGGGGMFAALSG